jgi:hypothetical protein
MRSIARALSLGCLAVMLGLVASIPAQEKSGKIRFGVGSLQPTPGETKKAYDPFFKYPAEKLNREYDLVHPAPHRVAERSRWAPAGRADLASPVAAVRAR